MTGSDEIKRRYWLGGRRAKAQDKFFLEALDPARWVEGDAENWDACWHTGMPAPEMFRRLGPGKTINHIPGNNGLTVKSLLYRTLKATRDRLSNPELRSRMAFFPRAYSMPADYHALQREALARPGARWIVKPKRESRGRGVEVMDDAGIVPLDSKWMVQDYLDAPHLYDGHKYVLRCYALITSVEPLRVYLFKEGFAKLASMPYTPDDTSNLFAHLTNPDINALNEELETPVVFVSFARYREWLNGQGGDADALFRQIRDIAVITAIAVRDRMRSRLARIPADTSGCYELIGLDCMVDADLKPWLLECNLSPSLDVCAAPDTGGEEEESIKRGLVADLVSILGLNEDRPDFRALGGEAGLRAEADWEEARVGGYERVFPGPDAGDFLGFFQVPGHADITLAHAASARPLGDMRLRPDRVREHVSGEGLALYSEKSGRYHAPGPTASWIWLKMSQGESADSIAAAMRTLAEESGADNEAYTEEHFRKEVWETFAAWGRQGLVCFEGDGESNEPPAVANEKTDTRAPGRESEWTEEIPIGLRGASYSIRCGAPEIAPRLKALTEPLGGAGAANADGRRIDILTAPAGYALASGPEIFATGLKLGAIAPRLRRHLLEACAGAVIEAAYVALDDERAVLLAGGRDGGWDSVADALARRLPDARLCGCASVLADDPGRASAIGLPCRVPSARGNGGGVQYLHQWRDSELGALIPADPDLVETSRRISAFILPRRVGGERDCEPERLAEPSALRLMNGHKRAPSAAEKLARSIESAPVYALRFSEADAAADQLANLLATIK